MDPGERFVETVIPLIWDWANDEITSLLLQLLFWIILVFKVRPWLSDLWDKITGHGTP